MGERRHAHRWISPFILEPVSDPRSDARTRAAQIRDWTDTQAELRAPRFRHSAGPWVDARVWPVGRQEVALAVLGEGAARRQERLCRCGYSPLRRHRLRLVWLGGLGCSRRHWRRQRNSRRDWIGSGGPYRRRVSASRYRLYALCAASRFCIGLRSGSSQRRGVDIPHAPLPRPMTGRRSVAIVDWVAGGLPLLPRWLRRPGVVRKIGRSPHGVGGVRRYADHRRV
jgi:hypothetical protein